MQRYILNELVNDHHDHHSSCDTTKQVQKTLSNIIRKQLEQRSILLVSIEYQMVDERFMKAQCHELQKIVQQIIIEDISLNENFQIAVIIGKLPLVGKISKTCFTIQQNNSQQRVYLSAFKLQNNFRDKIRKMKYWLFQKTKINLARL